MFEKNPKKYGLCIVVYSLHSYCLHILFELISPSQVVYLSLQNLKIRGMSVLKKNFFNCAFYYQLPIWRYYSCCLVAQCLKTNLFTYHFFNNSVQINQRLLIHLFFDILPLILVFYWPSDAMNYNHPWYSQGIGSRIIPCTLPIPKSKDA